MSGRRWPRSRSSATCCSPRSRPRNSSRSRKWPSSPCSSPATPRRRSPARCCRSTAAGRQMIPERLDAIVIGAGQAAPALCARLDKEGLKTALIERKLLGGTCVNNGCIPTKTLIASARAAHVARRGGDYGFASRAVRVDMAAVKRRKDHVVRQSVNGLKKWIAGMKHVSLVHGHAKFTAARRISVKGRELEAERIFINVGA